MERATGSGVKPRPGCDNGFQPLSVYNNFSISDRNVQIPCQKQLFKTYLLCHAQQHDCSADRPCGWTFSATLSELTRTSDESTNWDTVFSFSQQLPNFLSFNSDTNNNLCCHSFLHIPPLKSLLSMSLQVHHTLSSFHHVNFLLCSFSCFHVDYVKCTASTHTGLSSQTLD